MDPSLQVESGGCARVILLSEGKARLKAVRVSATAIGMPPHSYDNAAAKPFIVRDAASSVLPVIQKNHSHDAFRQNVTYVCVAVTGHFPHVS
jgi:hypothetical protein